MVRPVSKGCRGTWKDLNRLGKFYGRKPDSSGPEYCAGNTTAVANGDLSKKITVDVRGELRVEGHRQHYGGSVELFASEVTRVAREVGTEGRLGGQADVKGVAGTWETTGPIQ